MTDEIFNKINIKEFYKKKLLEQENRHKKFKKSAYQLEPNLKESPGGLRDLHNVLWISASQKKGKNFKELLANKVIDKSEYHKVNFHFNKIIKRRILLHF